MIVRIALVLSILYCPLRATDVPSGAELVFPKVYDVRDEQGTRVLRVNDKVTLNLRRSSILHDEFMLRTYRRGVPQHTYYDVDALEEDLFEDPKHFASVFLTEEDGLLKVEGVVGPNLKISPVEGMERTEDGNIPHALEVISEDDPKIQTVYGEPIRESRAKVLERARPADRYSVKKVHAEIRVVCDEKLRAGFHRSIELVKYLMVEFNCVKLRYLTTGNPEIHVKFRAIEISTRRQEMEYYKWLSYDAKIDALASLYKLVEYVEKKNNTYGKYDIVYFATGLDMVAVEGARQESALQGYAFVGSVCTRNRVGLGEDKAKTYIGIRIMSHEIGHTLGCSHDGSAIDGTIKHFKADSTGCPWEHGYLMSYIEEDGRSMKFSTCCDYSMSLVAWSTEIECMYHFTAGSRLKRYKTGKIPGRYLSKDKQCRMTYPTLYKTYFMPKFPIYYCIAQCFVPGDQFQASDSHWPMILIDGSDCATGRVCINGGCVRKRRRYDHHPVGK